ncbi:hypothetical protein DSL72_004112 [Monilinia vaccinii-corymbosi]|uniref:Uncharacterized protein n=1 Tax=Monilinia vaccinii-corymbosi TaxID=61207 RepID=A0A8A3P326_9HELO|nr:hypothetical protein DSL72_004112 [Monilinia vaccinii-corymbosi]
MVGVRTWTDDAVWFVLLASDILKPHASTSSGRNGKQNRRYTDEQIAILCRQNVEDLKHTPDENGVKYVRSTKKADYNSPNAPQPSQAVLDAIERLRRQSDTPLLNQDDMAGNRGRDERNSSRNSNIRYEQSSGISASSGSSANTAPIARSTSISRSPRPLPMRGPLSHQASRTIARRNLLQGRQISLHQFHALNSRNLLDMPRLHQREMEAVGRSEHNYPSSRHDDQQHRQGFMRQQNPRASSGIHRVPFLPKPCEGLIPPSFQPGGNQERLNSSMRNINNLPQSLGIHNRGQQHGNYLSLGSRSMSNSMHQPQIYDMGFNASNFQPEMQPEMQRFNSGMSMSQFWPTGDMGYPQNAASEFNGNHMVAQGGQGNIRESANTFHATPYGSNEGMMLQPGFEQASQQVSYGNPNKNMAPQLGSAQTTNHWGQQHSTIAVSDSPLAFDFDGMPTTQSTSHGFPPSTSRESSASLPHHLSQPLSNSFNIQNVNQNMLNNFNYDAFQHGFISQQPYSSTRSVRKRQRDFEEEGQPDMNSNWNGERYNKRHIGNGIGELEQMNHYAQEESHGQDFLQQRPTNTQELPTIAPTTTAPITTAPTIALAVASTSTPTLAQNVSATIPTMDTTSTIPPAAQSSGAPSDASAAYNGDQIDDMFAILENAEYSQPAPEPLHDQAQEQSLGNLDSSPTDEVAADSFDSPSYQPQIGSTPLSGSQSLDLPRPSIEHGSEQYKPGTNGDDLDSDSYFNFDLGPIPGTEDFLESIEYVPNEMDLNFFNS